MIDLDNWLLLRWQPEKGRSGIWLTLSRHDHPQHWHRLRCALFTTPPPGS